MDVTAEVRRALARMIAGARPVVLDPDLRRAAAAEGVASYLAWLAGDHGSLRPHAAVQLARRARLARLLDRLATAGVPAIVFKGAHLACTCYPDPAVRPHVDIDLLVAPERADAARQVFEEMGHRSIPHVSGRLVMSQFHYVDGEVGGAHAYDVHWRVANPPAYHRALPFEEVLAGAVRLPVFGEQGMGPSLPHALLIACIHRAAHHAASDRLLWLLDIRLLLQAAEEPDVERFCALAERANLCEVAADACERAAGLFGDVSVPERLQANAKPPTLRRWPTRSSPSSDLLQDLHSLDSWRDRATLVREHLFPPAAYIQATSGLPRAALPLAYAVRIIKGAARWTRPGR